VKTNQTSPSGLAVSDHRFGNMRQHVHPQENVITYNLLLRMIIYLKLTFPQDTQIVTGTVLIVKCQPMILNILTR